MSQVLSLWKTVAPPPKNVNIELSFGPVVLLLDVIHPKELKARS